MLIAKNLNKTLCIDLSFKLGGTSSAVQYRYLTDSTIYLRKGIRNSNFVVDIALSPTSFSGVEDIDWETLKMIE